MSQAARVGRWSLEHLVGSAADIHAKALPERPAASAWLVEPTAPAIVLGSSQRSTKVDLVAAGALGFDIVTRRSGGGAVVVVPGEMAWIDVIVPAGDALWDDDVTTASYWLGELWADVVRSYGHSATVHRGALRADDLARMFCFAGAGSGEVMVGDRKVVGISQRRTREAARFQCACVLHWNAEPAFALLPGLDAHRARVEGAGMGVGEGQPGRVSVVEVADRFVEALAHR